MLYNSAAAVKMKLHDCSMQHSYGSRCMRAQQ